MSLFLVGMILSSCSPYSIRSDPQLPVEPPKLFSAIRSVSTTSPAISQPWWLSYESDLLNKLVGESLKKNYTLQSVWSRLKQAKALHQVLRSGEVPQLNLSGNSSRNRVVNGAGNNEVGFLAKDKARREIFGHDKGEGWDRGRGGAAFLKLPALPGNTYCSYKGLPPAS